MEWEVWAKSKGQGPRVAAGPSRTPRVLREFKEYRPYPNIEKFRREMGKYWNEKEVARLERYVTVKP